MRLTCLVDNCVERSSALWGEHGLSFLVESAGSRLLWDTGQSGTVLDHNLRVLGLEELSPDAIALSHAHYDHTGGLLQILRRYPGSPIFAHSDLFRERYSRRGDNVKAIGLAGCEQEVWNLADLRLSDRPTFVMDHVSTTGSIQPRPYQCGASPHHAMRADGVITLDAYYDDQSLVLHVAGGIVLLCGCCHAGLRNTVATVRGQTDERLVAIIGGSHLAGASESELREIMALLEQEGGPQLYLNHCTGERALLALAQAFGDRVHPCPAGTRLEFLESEG